VTVVTGTAPSAGGRRASLARSWHSANTSFDGQRNGRGKLSHGAFSTAPGRLFSRGPPLIIESAPAPASQTAILR
jgi:hypothetical protein